MYHRTEIIGRIGQDPTVRYTPAGDAAANFSVAVSETWKNKSGEKQEKSTWYRCSVFGKLAEVIKEYAYKGQLVFVTGRMEERAWTDKDGQERKSWELRVDEFKMLSFKDEKTSDAPKKEAPKPGRSAQGAQPNSFDGLDDDIPFAPIGKGRMCYVI